MLGVGGGPFPGVKVVDFLEDTEISFWDFLTFSLFGTIIALGCLSEMGRDHKVHRYTRGCLRPISDMDFQFLATWAAQGSEEKKSNYELLATFELGFFMFSWAKKIRFLARVLAEALNLLFFIFFSCYHYSKKMTFSLFFGLIFWTILLIILNRFYLWKYSLIL